MGKKSFSLAPFGRGTFLPVFLYPKHFSFFCRSEKKREKQEQIPVPNPCNVTWVESKNKNIEVHFPNHQRWYAKWKFSQSMYTLHSRFRTFGTDLYAQSVLSNKKSASELGQKFIKSALLMGFALFKMATFVSRRRRTPCCV